MPPEKTDGLKIAAPTCFLLELGKSGHLKPVQKTPNDTKLAPTGSEDAAVLTTQLTVMIG